MALIEDFIPLRSETVDTIRARMEADVNAGIDPSDDAFIDTTPGGFWWDLSTAFALEAERLWDMVSTELPASTFVGFSWGDYLNEWGLALNVLRKAAVAATGTVTFAGKAGTPVAAGTQVGTISPDPDTDPREYVTTASVTIPTAVLPPPSALVGTPMAGGSLSAHTYYYVVTAFNDQGETLASSEVSVVVAASGKASLTWNPVTGAAGYFVYRGLTSGTESVRFTASANAYVDDGTSAGVGASPPSTNTATIDASVDAAVQSTVAGAIGNASIGAVEIVLSPTDGVSSVTNVAAISGGADVESDVAYRDRLLLELGGTLGAGTRTDYTRWALAYPGVGHVTVQALWAGAGTVRVVVTDAANLPVSAGIVTGLQALLDPVAGDGDGLAPVGAVVTVATPGVLPVTIAAAITHAQGYSLDGAAATSPTRAAITAALEAYVNGLQSGDSVVREHVASRFFTVPGVYDISGLTINTLTSGNVAVGPLQVAELVTPVTLT